MLDDLGIQESTESMKEECFLRMDAYHLRKDVIDAFKDGKILCSEDGKIVELPEEISQKIAALEDEFKNMYYHVIHTKNLFGKVEVYDILYTSCYMEDWEYEGELADCGMVMVRSENMTVPAWSASGTICIVEENGVLRRLY
jgi:hypothetical protein